jgi:chorismate mutase
MKQRRRFYIVAEEVMPEAMLKTVQAKTMLARGDVETVHDAVEKVGLSRSAFYKYRDAVFLQEDDARGKLVTISLILEHRSGILSNVLNLMAQAGGNIITINQGIPMREAAHVTSTVEIGNLNLPLEELIRQLAALQGVRRAEVVGYS